MSDEDFSRKIARVETIAASWARDYVQDRKANAAIRPKDSKNPRENTLPFDYSQEEIRRIFPMGVKTGGGAGDENSGGQSRILKRISETLIVQALVMTTFFYELMPLSHDPKGRSQTYVGRIRNFMRGFRGSKIARGSDVVKSPETVWDSTSLQERPTFEAQYSRRERANQITTISDKILFRILRCPLVYRNKRLRKGLNQVGEIILALCVEMAKAKAVYYFSDCTKLKYFDSRSLEEYFPFMYDDSSELRIYLVVYPPLMRKLDVNDTKMVSENHSDVVRKGKVILSKKVD